MELWSGGVCERLEHLFECVAPDFYNDSCNVIVVILLILTNVCYGKLNTAKSILRQSDTNAHHFPSLTYDVCW